MNKTLQKKLLSYSVLATAVLAVEKSADAQIVYHQVDTTLSNTGYYLLDLNGDGNYDFEIYCSLSHIVETTGTSGSSYSYFKVTAAVYAFNSNGVNNALRSQSAIADSHSAINEFVSFNVDRSYPTKSGYLGLELNPNSNGHTYMGWVRLSLSRFYPHSVTITSYAYELKPANSVVLGDSGCNHQPITPAVTLNGTDTLISTPSNKYLWYINGTPVKVDTTQSLINPPNGYYSVLTSDIGGCKAQSLPVNYSVCGSPSSNLLINSYYNEGCGNVNVTTQFNAENFSNFGFAPLEAFDSIKWYINGQLFDTTANPLYSFSKTINKETIFYAIAYNEYMQCYDTSNVVYDSVYPIPAIAIIVQRGDTLFATDSVNEVYIYTWTEDITNGYEYLRDTNYYYIPDSSGTYTVTIFNENGCDSTSLPYHYTRAGIDILSSNDIVKVYTIEDNIYINFSNSDFLNGIIELYNIEGQKLQEQTITNNTEILNAQQYAKGIYFVAITKNGVRKVYKVALL